MRNIYRELFFIAITLKILLFPAYYSTDFEVHRNWLAVTHSLPMDRWYTDETSQWTLDYPPFFAYFEWTLSQIAKFVDPAMLEVTNHNYASNRTVYFQRGSVVVTDLLFSIGVYKCLDALHIAKDSQQHFAGSMLLMSNIGLIFVDHIHFQYNGFLLGMLLFSLSALLEDKPLRSAFIFAVLLNFKHIFLYIAPAYAAYFLRFYCLNVKHRLQSFSKLLLVGILPFLLAYGPFWRQLPQVLRRLFPFKRGLTHAYWAPNFWALYNTLDKITAYAMGRKAGPSTSSGLVQEFEHTVLPNITPTITFAITALLMLPILVRLLLVVDRNQAKLTFMRSLVLCAYCSFMFGWHVHEKAILICLIPLTLLSLVNAVDAKYAFILSVAGYYSLMPLLFDIDLLVLRYSLFVAYTTGMYAQLWRIYNAQPSITLLERLYMYGFGFLPIYEHIVSPISGLGKMLPFMPLLLTSVYCSLGVLYVFIRYYIVALRVAPSTLNSRKVKNKKT